MFKCNNLYPILLKVSVHFIFVVAGAHGDDDDHMNVKLNNIKIILTYIWTLYYTA